MSSALVLDSLTKRYGSALAVDGVSLTVATGSAFGLFGPNGSGKTTTLECALGLRRATSGGALVLGEPPHRIHRLGGRVACVFDIPAFADGLRVDQNLEYARRLAGRPGGRDADTVLSLVGARELARRRAGKLSLGERKRVAIARALLGSPELLVLDEPLSGLDPFGVRRMLELLARLRAEGITLLVSSHRLREMESVVTHAGILHRGRLVRAGAIGELLAETHRLRVRAGPAEVAERVLLAQPGVRAVERVEHVPASGSGGHATLRVRLSEEGRPEGLNRSLIEAGCAVSELVPSAGGLDALFDELLREEEEGGTA